MKVYAINGSPRKNKNTATLLQKALDGVKEPFFHCTKEDANCIYLYTECSRRNNGSNWLFKNLQ
jgi:multimeric flavodoxin WrbA